MSLALATLTLVAGLLAEQVTGQGAADEAAFVAALVAERCAPCHSPAHPDAAAEPRALRKWSGAVDLAAVVATAVVPGKPDESDLYLSVELDEMPPSDSAFAPLTEPEKARLAAWITAGAQLGPPPAPTAPVEGPSERVATPTEAPASAQRAGAAPSSLELAGRFHPLVVHFPVGLLLAAVPAALLARLRQNGPWRDIADYCLALGAAGALAGSALGWCAHEAGAGALQPTLLTRHEWSGWVTTGLALAACAAARAARKGRPFGRFHLPLVLATAAAVSAAGHLGGALVWGEDYLPLPFPL